MPGPRNNKRDGKASSVPPHLAAGAEAEEYALCFLQAQGLRLVQRNFRCRLGEIDLVMDDGKGWVFVEVRYRRSARFGSAVESVDHRKQARLIATAQHFLQIQNSGRPARFDVIALQEHYRENGVHWIRNAIQAD
jgi:putative endonuclease